jgi:hypothetical protein
MLCSKTLLGAVLGHDMQDSSPYLNQRTLGKSFKQAAKWDTARFDINANSLAPRANTKFASSYTKRVLDTHIQVSVALIAKDELLGAQLVAVSLFGLSVTPGSLHLP